MVRKQTANLSGVTSPVGSNPIPTAKKIQKGTLTVRGRS